MSDSIESAAPPEVQAKAEAMGWIPPTRYKGEAERFVDAEEYIARGEQVLPIVRAQNRKLHEELEGVRAEQARTAEALKAATQALDEINERHSVETQKAVERSRAELKERLKVASENGDHEAIAEITGLMVDLKAAAEEPPPKKIVPQAPTPAQVPPELKEWQTANPWFGQDKRKTALALGIAQELRDAGTELKGAAFFEKVREEVEATFGATGREAPSKVEGARGNGESSGRSSTSKSFASLPEDAKAACDSDGKNFVGAGKRYKTLDEWRKRYTELYYQG